MLIFWASVGSSVLQGLIIYFGLESFTDYYNYQVDLSRPDVEYEEYVPGEDEEEEDLYDEYGCNADGLDVYGNECPAEEN